MSVIPQKLKEHRFGSIVPSGANLPAQYMDYSVTGTIRKVVFDYNNGTSTGSIWLAVSGTGEEIARVNGFSGTSDKFVRYPIVYGFDGATTGSPQAFIQPVTNSPLFVAASGIGSNLTVDNVIVYWE